jgi:putative ABC transport system ATP-binding protein
MKTLVAKNLKKTFTMGETVVNALNNVDIEIEKGELVSITGQSGSGKTTLMNVLGCLDVPSDGEYFIDGKNVAHLSRDKLAEIRNKKIGFVFQKFHLLPDLTAIENVELPALYAGISEKEARKKSLEMLKTVELEHRIDHYPYQLSGGQQQRVAIARSLINNPSIILADEPTGNLDSETGKNIIELFKKLNLEKNVTIIIVTHENYLAKSTNRVITLKDGKVV